MTDEQKARAKKLAKKFINRKKLRETYGDCICSLIENVYIRAYKQALCDKKEGREEIIKEWHDCFLSCSSPYCAGHFPAVKMQGGLGNMSKHERE